MAFKARSEERRSFKYQERSREDVRERANMRGGQFDSFIKSKCKVFKPRDGKNVIRILPPTWDKAKHYGYDIFVNYGIGVDNQSYLSLSKMKQEADPLAEAKREAERDGDKKLAKALTPRQRICFWLIDRNDEDAGPQFWAAPFTVDKAIANICFDEDTKEVVYIDDPETGCDLRFYKEGQGMKTDYDASKMRLMKPSPIHDDEKQQQEWLEYIQENPVPDCLQFYDYDHIAGAFDGHARVEGDDDEDKPQRGRGKDDERSNRRREEPEEDERPARSSRRREEPESEEEPPRRSRERSRAEPPEEEPEAPRRTRTRAEPEVEEAEPEPRRPARSRARVEEEPPFEEEPPRRGAGKRREEPEEPEEDERPARGESVRERIRRSRGKSEETEED